MSIVLVQNDSKDLKLLKKYVKEYYPDECIIEFFEADKALDYIEENQVKILFTDIVMKKASGFALSEAAKENNRYAKVIFIADTSEYALAARKAFINDYLIKPITKESIKHTFEVNKDIISGGTQYEKTN